MPRKKGFIREIRRPSKLNCSKQMKAKHVMIIAEAGVNHNGSMENAFRLVDAAADAGVDYIKFQTFKAEKLVSGSAKKADYQIQNTRNAEETQLQMLQKLELSQEQHAQ